jgi:hypothetical protein
LRLQQERRTTGSAADKQKEEDEMIAKTIEVASAVYAYASITNNNTLKDKIDYSPTALKRSRDTILRDIWQVIHDEAIGVGNSLADYGVDANDLAQLQKEIDDYAALLTAPRTAITTRVRVTAELEEKFKEGDEILHNQMDKLVETLKEREKRFYREYNRARLIIKLGSRRGGDDDNKLF